MWGRSRDGGLCDGNGHSPKANLTSPTLFEEKNGSLFKQISCGKDHVAAVTTDGKLLTFGNPNHGKLGHKIEEVEEKPSGGFWGGGSSKTYQPTSISD